MSRDWRPAAVAVAGMANFLNLYTPQAVLPALAASFDMQAAGAGLAVTAPLIAVALVAPFAGAISDRIGRRVLIVGALFLLVVPTLLIATSPTMHILLLWRFLQGVLLPFIFAVCVAYIGDEIPGPAGIRAASLYSAGTIFGGFGGRFVAGLVAEWAGWRMGFVAVAGLTLAAAVFVAITLKPERTFRPVTGGLGGTLRAYGAHLRNRRLLATCAIGFGMLFSNVAVYSFVNFYLAAPPFSLSPAQLGGVFVVYLLGVFTTAMAARVAIRIGRIQTLALALGLAGCGMMLTLLPRTAWVIAGLAGLSGGLLVVQALCIGVIPVLVSGARSSAVGLYVTTYYVGGALGGFLPAFVWQSHGWPGVVALVCTVFVAMLGLAVWQWPRKDAPAPVA